MGKKSNKRQLEATEDVTSEQQTSEPIPKKPKWTNRQRVLVLGSRGINFRDRHLMEDIKTLMPHHRAESKIERSKTLNVLNEIAEIRNCNKTILFEGRRKKDLYMWLSAVPNGPSVKFFVENVYTMAELKLTGNCLRGSRPILSFDNSFNEKPHYALMKDLLSQTFGVPNYHPKSQPFFDHVYTFTILDNRIWFRNFQILSEDGALVEIGPRFVLNPIKIFSGSFAGAPLWENEFYVSPAKFRQQFRLNAKNKYLNRLQQKVHAEATRPKESYKMNPLDSIFVGDEVEMAKEIVLKEAKKSAEENGEKKEKKKAQIKKKKIVNVKQGKTIVKKTKKIVKKIAA